MRKGDGADEVKGTSDNAHMDDKKDKDNGSEEIKKDESERDEESKAEVKVVKKDPKLAILEAMDDF